MMGIHEVTDEELPRYIEFLTETFYPRSISVSINYSAILRRYVAIICYSAIFPHASPAPYSYKARHEESACFNSYATERLASLHIMLC